MGFRLLGKRRAFEKFVQLRLKDEFILVVPGLLSRVLLVHVRELWLYNLAGLDLS